MKIQIKDIHILFEKIQEELNISYVSIVIFTAVDVDSICTLKIFSKIFKCENIQYKVYPVTNYTEMSTRIQESRAYDKVKLFMFINCGGLIDLTEYWIVQQKQAQIFLFDVNKPIHHKNLESQDIRVIDDGFSEFQNCPTSQEIEKYEQLNEYDLDDADEEEDQQQKEDYVKMDDSPKRGNKKNFKEKLRKHKSYIQKKYTNYYAGNFVGYPSSYSAYMMVRNLEKANNDYLWYAIVGTTSMFLEQRITKETLDSLSQIFKSDVSRFNAAKPKKDKGDIQNRKGYQFPLLDHWSLYDSMLNSNYMMTKLRLWQDMGINTLHQFIHQIGISLQQARQLYKHMTKDSQNKLEKSIIPCAQKFKLHEVMYLSFIKYVDYTVAYMASDYYYILTSILETLPTSNLSLSQLSDHRIRYFWQAYDTFDGPLKNLTQRVEDYKRMSKIMMTETKSILQRDHIITVNSTNITNIRNDTDDKKIFEHPSALMRMANLLMGILKQKKRSNTFKPFIANCIDLQKEICLVVGVMMDSKNTIGSRFNSVAERLKIQVNQDNFMSNIIMIQKEHITQFIKEIGFV